ncbi:glycoside hydrolase [Panaeolus papilionaceus]|nr:glycoside hydrolase [Panaeolus papilionaceus]
MAQITLSMQAFLLVMLFLNSVNASGGIESYVAAGIAYEGWHPYTSSSQTSIARPYSTYNPILDILSTSMSCNNNGAPGPNQLSATIPAGSQFTARYTLFRDVVGPVLVYMADCEGKCSTRNSRELKWFKIAQTGYLGSGGVAEWGAGLVASTLQYTATIPPNLAAKIRW